MSRAIRKLANPLLMVVWGAIGAVVIVMFLQANQGVRSGASPQLADRAMRRFDAAAVENVEGNKNAEPVDGLEKWGGVEAVEVPPPGEPRSPSDDRAMAEIAPGAGMSMKDPEEAFAETATRDAPSVDVPTPSASAAPKRSRTPVVVRSTNSAASVEPPATERVEKHSMALSAVLASPSLPAAPFGLSGSGVGGGGVGGGGSGGGGLDLGGVAGLGSGGGVARDEDAAGPDASEHESLALSAASSWDEDSAIDRALDNLPIANIAFNTPEEIPLGDTAIISLLLSMREDSEELASAIGSPGAIETARVQVSNQMQASLTGLGFEIEPITPDTQAVSRRDRTQWRWQIRPTETEVQPLHLTLSARVRVEGESLTRTIDTFERTIHVRVPITRQVQEFVAGNLELAATFILAPLAAAAWRTYRRRRNREFIPTAKSQAAVERRAA